MSDSENLVPGIYEQVLSKKLKSHVDKLLSINDKKAFLNKLDKAEASSVLSNYMASILKTCLDIVAEKAKKKDDAGSDDYKLHSQIDFINDLISKIKFPYQEEKNTDEILLDRTGQMLLSIADNDTSFQNNLEAIEAKDLERPDTSILFSDLFTGAKADYQLMSELQKEIKSADEICLLVSFIKYSGFIKIREALIISFMSSLLLTLALQILKLLKKYLNYQILKLRSPTIQRLQGCMQRPISLNEDLVFQQRM